MHGTHTHRRQFKHYHTCWCTLAYLFVPKVKLSSCKLSFSCSKHLWFGEGTYIKHISMCVSTIHFVHNWKLCTSQLQRPPSLPLPPSLIFTYVHSSSYVSSVLLYTQPHDWVWLATPYILSYPAATMPKRHHAHTGYWVRHMNNGSKMHTTEYMKVTVLLLPGSFIIYIIQFYII